ncbi:Ig-like domain-containing protein [Sulfurimonas sp.]|nr:Ig-like domain-containing protein [Sulfurimonas sp.]
MVIAYQLNADGTRSGTDLNTTTTDNKGSFTFGTRITWSGATEFEIYGEYLNENTGTYMNLPASEALTAVTDTASADVNINIFTNIAAPGIKAEMAKGNTIATAKATAQDNVAKLFNINLDAGVELTDLDLTDNSTNTEANTQLLLVSAAILNTANPEQVMEDLAADMADGEVDDGALGALEEVKEKAAAVDIEEVAAKMSEADIGVTTLAVANVFDGLLAFDHNISFTKQNDAFLSTTYTSNEATVVKVQGTSAATVTVSGGSYSIDGGAFVTTAGTITNGQTIRARGTSSDSYETSTPVTVTIGGGIVVYDIVTQSDPFVADTTPNKFTFGFVKDENSSAPATVTSPEVMITGINTATSVSIDTGKFSKNGGTCNLDTTDTITVETGDTIAVCHTSSGSAGTQVKSTVTIGDVNGTFSSFTLPEDTTPNQFSFTPVNDVNNTSADGNITSENITISGINTNTPISVSGGEYSVDNGMNYTTTSGTIANGDTIKLRGVRSSDFDTTTTVAVTVGNVIGEFKITTMSDPFVADTTPNAFMFPSKFGQAISTNIDSNATTISGINTSTSISITGGEYSIDNGGFTSTEGNITNGQSVVVRHNIATFDTQETATLTIGGVSATFKAKTIKEDKTPELFSFDSNTSAATGSTATSNTVVISGLSTGSSLAISIVDGEYSLDGGATFTDAAASAAVANDTNITLRATASLTQGEAKRAILTVGNVIRSFTVITAKNAPSISGTPDVTVAEDAAYSFQATTEANSGEIASWSIANKPSWAVFNTVNGLLTGTPTNDNVGVDSNITITAVNNVGSTSLSAFDINVTNTNDAPDANNTSVGVTEDIAKNIDVTGLISDVDAGDSIASIAVTTQPTNGTISGTDGNFTYTPTANYFGSDSFVYTATDSNSATDTGTVTITVAAVNDAPTAVADTATTAEETPITIVVKTNDVDIDSAELNVTAVSTSADANATFVGGSIVYTPVTDFVGTDTFEYTISDGFLESNATVTVTVTNVNDIPVAGTFTAPTTAPEDSLYTFDANATDGDSGTSFTYTLANNPSWMSISGSTVSGTPENTDVGTTTGVQVLVSDGVITSPVVIKTFDITVTNTNDAPVAQDASIAVVMDNNYTGTLSASDVDVGDTLTYSVVSNGSNGTLTITDSSTGAFTYEPTTSYEGNDTITFKATDANSTDSNTATLSIVVADRLINITANTDAATVAEDNNLTIDVLANDTATYDDDGSVASGSVISAVSTANDGNVTIVSNELKYVPDANFNGTETLTYTAKALDGSENNATVTITVSAVNDVTIWGTVSSLSAVDEDFTEFTQELNATDVDGAVAYSLVSTQGIVSASVSGSTLTVTKIDDLFGAESIVVKATEGGVDSNHTITLQVNPVNDAPTITSFQASQTTTTDISPVSISYTIADVDNNLTYYNLTATSDYGTVNINVDGATLTFTPENVFGTTEATISLTVTDYNLTSAPSTVTITTTISPTSTAGGFSTSGITLHEIESWDGEIEAWKTILGAISGGTGDVTVGAFEIGSAGTFVSSADNSVMLIAGSWVNETAYFTNNVNYTLDNGNIVLADTDGTMEYMRIGTTYDLGNPSSVGDYAVIAGINAIVPGDDNVSFTAGAEAYSLEHFTNRDAYTLWSAVKHYDTNTTYATLELFFDSNITIAGVDLTPENDTDGWMGVDFERVSNTDNAVVGLTGANGTIDDNGSLVVYNATSPFDVNRTVGTWKIVELPGTGGEAGIVWTPDANASYYFGGGNTSLIAIADISDGNGAIVRQGEFSPVSTAFESDSNTSVEFNTQAFEDIEDAIETVNTQSAYFMGNTKYFVNSNGEYATRTFNVNGTYTGTYLGQAVDGNYSIGANGLTITLGTSNKLVYTYVGVSGTGREYDSVKTIGNNTSTATVHIYDTQAERDADSYFATTLATKAILSGKTIWSEGDALNTLESTSFNTDVTKGFWVDDIDDNTSDRGEDDVSIQGNTITFSWVDNGVPGSDSMTITDTSNLETSGYVTMEDSSSTFNVYLDLFAARDALSVNYPTIDFSAVADKTFIFYNESGKVGVRTFYDDNTTEGLISGLGEFEGTYTYSGNVLTTTIEYVNGATVTPSSSTLTFASDVNASNMQDVHVKYNDTIDTYLSTQKSLPSELLDRVIEYTGGTRSFRYEGISHGTGTASLLSAYTYDSSTGTIILQDGTNTTLITLDGVDFVDLPLLITTDATGAIVNNGTTSWTIGTDIIDYYTEFSYEAEGDNGTATYATATFGGDTYTMVPYSTEVAVTVGGGNTTTFGLNISQGGVTVTQALLVSSQYENKEIVIKAYKTTDNTFNAATFSGSTWEHTANGNFVPNVEIYPY